MATNSKEKVVGSREYLEKVCLLYGLPFNLITDLQISSSFNGIVEVRVVFLADHRIFAIDEEYKKLISESGK